MQNKINHLEAKIPADLVEQMYFLRENELVAAKIARKKINQNIANNLQGKTSPKEIRVFFRRKKKREIKRISQLIKDLEQTPFVINKKAHKTAIELVAHLQNKFPNETIQLVVFGSQTHGGSVLKEQLVINPQKPSDFDCGVLIKGAYSFNMRGDLKGIDVKKYKSLQKLRNQITECIKEFLKTKGYDLCRVMNPLSTYATAIESVQDAEIMLERYFHKLPNDTGLMYFKPTYPISSWKNNLFLIQQALVKIKRKNSTSFYEIIDNIEQLLNSRHELHFNASHLSGAMATDLESKSYDVAIQASISLTKFIRPGRTQQIIKSKKPNYILR